MHSDITNFLTRINPTGKGSITLQSYLLGRAFLIRIDHYILKYLLEKRLTTFPQQHWISKLLGFDFRVEYKAGALNRAANELSWREEEVGQLSALSQLKVSLFDATRREIEGSEELQRLQTKVEQGDAEEGWTIRERLILLKTRIYRC